MLADELHQLALRQLADYDGRTPNRIFSGPLELTVTEAYEIQHQLVWLRERRGESVIGYKVGCTSTVIQRQLGIHEPIYGRIFSTGCFASGARISGANYANLAIEGELAVRLAKDLLEPLAADEEYAEAIETVFPVIELHHYRLRSARPCCQELIASNGMHAGMVWPEERGGGPCSPAKGCEIKVRIETGAGGIVAESSAVSQPIGSLRWLALRLATFGLCLVRGQVVLTGSPMKLYPVTPGHRIVVETTCFGKSCAEVVS
ncbi:MAG TPA: fumarylacetoacetate hydrolase family protein [Pirellulales bacterium]|nr:fumarylacetoacetate hydrolase family protein [Pirellulales bacterium]